MTEEERKLIEKQRGINPTLAVQMEINALMNDRIEMLAKRVSNLEQQVRNLDEGKTREGNFKGTME